MDNSVQSGPIDPRLVSIARVVPHQVGLVKLSKTQLRVLKSIREKGRGDRADNIPALYCISKLGEYFIEKVI